MDDPSPSPASDTSPERRDGCLLAIVALVFGVVALATGIAADRTAADLAWSETTRVLDTLQVVCWAAALVVGIWALLKLSRDDK